jgi:hypothetical protein
MLVDVSLCLSVFLKVYNVYTCFMVLGLSTECHHIKPCSLTSYMVLNLPCATLYKIKPLLRYLSHVRRICLQVVDNKLRRLS